MSMILVDTSVWIEHLRKTDTKLVQLLEKDLVLIHPFVIGELACGNLHNRSQILMLLENLPGTKEASNQEVLSKRNEKSVALKFLVIAPVEI